MGIESSKVSNFLVCFIMFCSFAESKNYEVDLNQYLEERGYTKIEGNISSRNTNQPEFFKKLLSSNPSIRIIGEIGFNAGHSSVIFLETKPDTYVYSFDIVQHEYVYYGKQFVDQNFPNRHCLIEGDSSQSVPLFHAENPLIKFDLIFIDGGHEYEMALKDIQNMWHLAHKNTIVIVDDAHPGSNVQKAFTKCKMMNLIKNDTLIISNDHSKAWIVCNYIFDK